MRILLKYPTRGRPQQFLATLKGWLDNAADLSRISVLVSYDADDATMTPEVIAQAENMHPALVAVKGNSKTKIEACNADLNEYQGDWQVVLLISDDMWCRRQGWDTAIVLKMQQNFSDTDGVLWFHDGTKQRVIMTLSCIGRRYYERDRFIYHPSYSSFFCDNEATEVAQKRGRIIFIEHPLCTHEQPSWNGGMKRDATYARNNVYWRRDEANYKARKAAGFPA